MFDTIPVNDSVIYLVQKAVQDTVFVIAQNNTPAENNSTAMTIAWVALVISLIPIIFNIFKLYLERKAIIVLGTR